MEGAGGREGVQNNKYKCIINPNQNTQALSLNTKDGNLNLFVQVWELKSEKEDWI